MTTENPTFPGFYDIDQMVIYPAPFSEQGRSALDIRPLVAGMTIEESINNDSIRGSLKVFDAAGVLEHYPIRGEEKLFISIVDALGNSAKYYCFVYRADGVDTPRLNDKSTYSLYFVSYQRFYADTKRIITALKDTASGMIEQVFNKYYRESSSNIRTDSNKQIIVEETEGLLDLIIPNYTPLQAIRLIESRSYSQTSPTCSFRFFERPDSYYFVSDEFLYKKAQQSTIVSFTLDDFISRSPDKLVTRMNNLSDLKNSSRFDVLDDIRAGAYKNRVLVLDILNRTTNATESTFDYMQARSKWFGGAPELPDRHSEEFIQSVFTDENAQKFIMIKDYASDGGGQLRGEQYIPEIAQNRLSYMKHLNSIIVTANSPGRFDITCGDFIRVDIQDFIATGVSQEPNRQLSGLYLVESVTRQFGSDDMFTNSYTLLKRNWSESGTNGAIVHTNGVAV